MGAQLTHPKDREQRLVCASLRPPFYSQLIESV